MPGVPWKIGYVLDEIVYLHKESSRKNVNSASWLFLAMYDKILYKSRKEATEFEGRQASQVSSSSNRS